MKLKDEILVQTRHFKDRTDQLCNEWHDEIGKRFAVKYIDPITDSGVHYAGSVEDVMNHLDRALVQLRKLAGMSTLYYPGTPDERGDRAGGTSPESGNIIDLSYFMNSNRQK